MADFSFLMTDIEGSTRLLRRLEDLYLDYLEITRAVLSETCAEHGGRHLGAPGDSFLAAFEDPSSVISAALEAQAVLLRETRWASADRPKIRMGVHRGPASEVGVGMFGLTVPRDRMVESIEALRLDLAL